MHRADVNELRLLIAIRYVQLHKTKNENIRQLI